LPWFANGVARVPCALRQEIFLRPHRKKAAEFEMKNRYKSAKEAKAKNLLCVLLLFFQRQERHDKAISEVRSDNTGAWG